MEQAVEYDFICAICQGVLSKPLMHTECNHSFCSACINTHLAENSGKYSKCPICRENLKTGQLINNKTLADRINLTVYNCSCGKRMKYHRYNQHLTKCSDFQKALAQGIRMAPKSSEPVVNRTTFKCPSCKKMHLTREKLLVHYSRHAGRAGVCPICAVMPWNNSSHSQGDLFRHLNRTHQYDFETYTDYSLTEEEMLARVLEESLYTN